jgi:lambda family phage tail tape measure protein
MAVIGSLSVKLGLVTVEWDKATKQAKQQARELQSALDALTNNFKGLGRVWNSVGGALGVGVGSFGALTASALAFSNEVNDMSEGFGLSIPKVLQFRDAVQTSGGTAEKAGVMIGKMYQMLEEAGRGTETAISKFEAIGISFKELETLTPEKALQRVTEQISKIEDASKRATYTREFFGKGGIGVNLESVSAKLNKTTKDYDEHAAAIKRVGEFSDNLKTTMDNLKIAMTDLIAPFTGDGLIGIKELKALLITIAAAATIAAVTKIVGQFIILAKALNDIRKSTATIKAMQLAKNPAAALAAAAGVTALMAGDTELYDLADKRKSVGATGEWGEPEDKKSEEEAKKQIQRDELAGAKAQISAAQKLIDIEKRRNDMRIEYLDKSKYATQIREIDFRLEEQLVAIKVAEAAALAKNNLSLEQRSLISAKARKDEDLAKAKAFADQKLLNEQAQRESDILNLQNELKEKSRVFDFQRIELDRNKYYLTERQYQLELLRLETEKKINELEGQLLLARKQMGEGFQYQKEKERINEEIENEKRLYDAKKKTLDIEQQRRQSFTEGWESAYRKYVEDSQNYAKMGEESFTLVVDNMNQALSNFVNTGNLNFKSLVQSIIQGLLRIQLQMQASQMFSMAGKLFSTAFTYGTNPFSEQTAMLAAQTAGMGFADGGIPPVGVPSLVGENGPELFIPRTAGTIVPNQQMAGMTGTPQVVYNGPYIANMQAIDTQSAAQFLARNKESVWAANQSASRSVPQSR